MEKQVKLRWSDLLNVWLWHRFPKDELVTDDLAYVAMLRIGKFVEYALATLEHDAPVDGGEQQ